MLRIDLKLLYPVVPFPLSEFKNTLCRCRGLISVVIDHHRIAAVRGGGGAVAALLDFLQPARPPTVVFHRRQ